MKMRPIACAHSNAFAAARLESGEAPNPGVPGGVVERGAAGRGRLFDEREGFCLVKAVGCRA